MALEPKTHPLGVNENSLHIDADREKVLVAGRKVIKDHRYLLERLKDY